MAVKMQVELKCPVCGGELEHKGDTLWCRRCNRYWMVGGWNIVLVEVPESWSKEEDDGRDDRQPTLPFG